MKVKILKKLFLMFILFNSFIFILFFNQYLYYNNSFNRNSKHDYDESENFLRSSFTLTFTENFQTQTYRNESITNSTGWGKDYLSLVHQEVINLSNYDYNFDQINSIKSQGNLLFLADNSNGLKVLNISNPTNPTLISQYGDTYNNTLDISIQGKFGYIADGMDGMEIIDISKPKSEILTDLSLAQPSKSEKKLEKVASNQNFEFKFNVPKISIQELSNMQKKLGEDDFNIDFKLTKPEKIIETLENLGVPQNIENKAFEIVLRAIYQKITSEIYSLSFEFAK